MQTPVSSYHPSDTSYISVLHLKPGIPATNSNSILVSYTHAQSEAHHFYRGAQIQPEAPAITSLLTTQLPPCCFCGLHTHTQNEVNYSNALDMCFPQGEIRFGGVSVRAYSWGINKCSLKPVWERQKDPPTPPTITIMFFIPLHVLTLNMSRGRLALLFLTHFHPSYTHVQKEVVREGLTSTSCIWSLWIKE